MIDSGASHSFVTEFVVKSHYYLVDYTEPMSIYLATGSEVILDSICTIPTVFCDMGGHVINKYITSCIM